MKIIILLLRGINVGGHKKVPMAELRTLATELGFENVQTYIQSGNLVVSTDQSAAAAENLLEAALQRQFGFAVDVVARTAAQWKHYAAGSPFSEAETERPNLLHLGVSKQTPRDDAQAKLAPYATAGEHIEIRTDAIWIDFPSGVARSKLSPAVIDRCVGSPVTLRNWRTVQKLAELAGE